MDIISGLSEELLIKILSYLPTKVAVSTSLLSKQWEFIWMWLPKLEYNSKYYSESECERLRCFLDRNLPLHRAPVLESFRIQFRHPHLKPEDIKLWLLTVVSRCIRELEVSYSYPLKELNVLPSSLYTCKLLVTLRLNGPILLDVPRMVCLPCLKKLRLHRVTYVNKGSLQRLLSNCPVLNDLSVEEPNSTRPMRNLSVIVPSLLRLTIDMICVLDEFVINTPSLEYLKLEYYSDKSHRCLIENMPKLREASVEVLFPYIKRLIGSITNVKKLTLCLSDCSEPLYGDGFVFNQLEHLKLCVCPKSSSNVLVQLLKDSPNLRVLDLFEMEDHVPRRMDGWNQPTTVPECLLSSLETFNWSGYLGRPQERDIAIYILKNARCLKTVKILSEACFVSRDDMLKELALCPRASTTCQLVFDS
ncbi:unnamed protein product [Microthlaspi erraticum]|uniref:FBD domain-containing protein n=1 Tax=Microthlaspi erraticum TaxID=1685480 RepID=A0A6D2KTX7_9BRAS|nr:unnamed protein product [Microthlaspi erraticum]